MTDFRVSIVLRTIFPVAIALLLGACASTKVVNTWQSDLPDPRKPEKVAVVAVLPDALMRQAVEVDIAKILKKKGSPAVASSTLPGMSGGIRGRIDTEKATEILTSDGVDGVVVLFYTGGGRANEYERNNYYADYVGTGIGYGWAAPYTVDVYTVHQVEDITEFTMMAFVESSYHDLVEKRAVWRIITQTNDTEHADTAESVANKIANQMSAAGLN